jgi:hypothetical protein
MVLKTVYTSASQAKVQLRALANNDAGQNNPVDYPHLNILATATPGQVLSTISDAQIEDGLMGRFLLFFGNNDPEEKAGKMRDVPPSMIQWFKDTTGAAVGDVLTVCQDVIDEIAPATLKIMKRSPEATERLDNHYIQIRRKTRAKIKAGTSLPEQSIWSRASEKTAKLALLFAASRGSRVIEIEDANRAIAVNNHITRRVVRAYQNRIRSEYQQHRKRVLDTVNTSFTTEAQFNRMNSSIDPQLRRRITEDLIDSKEIHQVIKGGKLYYVLGPAPE